MTRARDLADGADKDIAGTLTLDDIVLSNDMSVADNGKVQFGAGNDLQIYHDASHSYIVDAGTGNFYLSTDGNGIVMQASLSETMFAALPDGAVTLYHDNAAKLATASTGVDVTGLVKTSNAYQVWLGANVLGSNGGLTSIGSNPIVIGTDGTERMLIDSSGNVGIGTSSPDRNFHVESGGDTYVRVSGNRGNGNNLHIGNVEFENVFGSQGVVAEIKALTGNSGTQSTRGQLAFYTDDGSSLAERMRIRSGGEVAIGGSGYSGQIFSLQTSSVNLGFMSTSSTTRGVMNFNDANSNVNVGFGCIGNNHVFMKDASEKMRLDSSGNLLVGKTALNNTTDGFYANADGLGAVNTDARCATFVRNTSDGAIVEFRKGGTTVGEIGHDADSMYVGNSDTGLIFQGFFNDAITPYSHTAQNIRDDAIDLGYGSSRFDDIFATNTSITTSDQTEKQQIAALTSAEMTAAKAISALFKTYKWNKSVTNNGDAARIHTGVIAQEVQTAMTDAGLNAAHYAFWCSNTWWEADETYTNEEGAEQTRTRQYHVEDEAPEGATQRTRLGIRYPELLAFVGAATEQRLADIETRLTALEAAE